MKKILKGNCFSINYNQDLFKKKSSVYIQGCNCFNTMGAGIAYYLKEKFPMVFEADLKTIKGDRNKLGNFTYARVDSVLNSNTIYVANLYSQYTFYDKNDMFYIDAFENGMKKIIEHFCEERTKKNIPISFSFPAIGLGLANGKIEEVYEVLKKLGKEYKDNNITLNLCLHPKDKKLDKEFKKLEEKEKKILDNTSLEIINRELEFNKAWEDLVDKAPRPRQK